MDTIKKRCMPIKRDPWDHPEIPKLPWRTQSSFYSWMRGVLRAGWSTNPLKLEYLKATRIRISNPNPNGRNAEVWGHECALCHKQFIQSEVEVDHKHGNNTLKCKEDIQSFVERLFLFDFCDLQTVCRPCHKAKSYGEKQGMGFEEAKIEKEVIKICKLPADEQTAWIILNDPSYYGVKLNAKQRRDEIRKILSKE